MGYVYGGSLGLHPVFNLSQMTILFPYVNYFFEVFTYTIQLTTVVIIGYGGPK